MVSLSKDDSANVHFVLASGSPRRKQLLENLGASLEVIPGDLDENTPLTDPEAVVRHLAQEKASLVARALPEEKKPFVVLGADTIVVLGKQILGKPQSHQEAFDMLMSLSGKEHQVYTGVCVIDSSGSLDCTVCVSRVFFRKLEEKEVEYYVATEEPMDKAGAYALQGIASAFVEKVDGCYTNIIGLPVPDTITLLRRHGVKLLGIP